MSTLDQQIAHMNAVNEILRITALCMSGVILGLVILLFVEQRKFFNKMMKK